MKKSFIFLAPAITLLIASKIAFTETLAQTKAPVYTTPVPTKPLLSVTPRPTKPLLSVSPAPTKPLLSPAPTRPPKELFTETIKVQTKLQVEDTDTGKTIVKTESGEKELLTNPDQIKKLSEKEGVKVIKELSLVETSGKLKYIVSGDKAEKFLGIFSTDLPTTLTFDSDSAKLESKNQSMWTKIIDFLSV